MISNITSMTSDQNCTTRSSITILLHPVLKSHNLIVLIHFFFFVSQVPIFYCSRGRFFRKKQNRKRLHISILKSSVKISVERNKGKTFLIQFDWLFYLCVCSHWLKKRCNLGPKIVRFVNKSHCCGPIKLQGSPVISKWM